MSLAILSMECRGAPAAMDAVTLAIVAYTEPDHAACSGGEHRDGVMGGWTCVCPCHRDAIKEDE